MGFTITNEYTIPKFGITLSNLYVTLSGAYSVRKTSGSLPVIGHNGKQLSINAAGGYVIQCTYTVSSAKGAQCLYHAQQTLHVPEIPIDIYADLYAAIKGNFPNCTFVNQP
jgi:hypothetical protein